jgi:hypothetical protein
MPYRNWASGDTLNAADLNAMMADPQIADVATDETKSSGSYGDLTTVGPSVTLTLVSGQACLVIVSSRFVATNDGAIAYAGWACSGATTIAAVDSNSAYYFAVKIGVNTAQAGTRASVAVATATGSHTFTMKYKGDGTNTMHFLERRILVKKF